MLTPAQQRAVDRFAKSLSALGDDSLIDAYHQAWEDHRDARAEGSDNLGKAGAESSCDRSGNAGAFFGLSKLLQAAVPVNQLVVPSLAPVIAALVAAGIRFLEFFVANIRNPHTRRAYARAAEEFLA